MIRHIGLDEDQCRTECQKQWDSVQRGQGQCSVEVKNPNIGSIAKRTFELCKQTPICSSNILVDKNANCSLPPPLSECLQGCSQYQVDNTVERLKPGTKYMMAFAKDK